VTAVESELERALSSSIMSGDAKHERRRLAPGDTLVEQGQEGGEVFLLLDGMLDVEVDGETVAQVGPGAVLGERAIVDLSTRTATLRAATPARVVVVPGDQIDLSALEQLADSRRGEG
jgi:CRP-like cAMP-binding protein